jgi:LacI family transcriptional regulator
MVAEKITMREVAQRAGVSLGTASNALNNRGNVTLETRNRVLEAAEILGYHHQSRTPTTLPTGLSVIGAVGKVANGETITINPFYSHVLSGIEQATQSAGISLMIANITVDSMNRLNRLPPMLMDRQVDGVLMIGTFLPETIQSIGSQFEKPVVLVDAYAPGSDFDSVVMDNLNGAIAAVDYLIALGHRQIGLVGSMPNTYPSIRERRKGYLRALKHHNITQPYIENSALSRDGGYQATLDLLRRSPEITAIFACNDESAFGVYDAARVLGLRIPQDLSVIGFDDIDFAANVTPPLTTVRIDKKFMGRLAVQMLMERAASPERPVLTTTISTILVKRGSVRARAPR